MRADRLLSLLLLLQTRGRCSARQLADTLEVSERTIYRDVEALSIAGIPVFAERGPGGGISLLDSYRTTLTGLNEDEVQALFLLNIPASLEQLGISQNLKTALLKLTASLPATLRDGGQRARQRIYLDSSPWSPNEEALQKFFGAYTEPARPSATERERANLCAMPLTSASERVVPAARDLTEVFLSRRNMISLPDLIIF